MKKDLTIKEVFGLAAKNHQEGRLDVAQEFYNQVLKINPNYAKAHNIRPNFEVPKSSTDNENPAHHDNNLQTLFYPEDLERKGRALQKDTKRILDEKGTNTLHLSFGCLEWLESKDTSRNSPLLLLQVKLTENATAKGPEYFIESTEGELFTNLPLSLIHI